MANNFYSPNDKRSLNATRVVFTEADFRNALTQAYALGTKAKFQIRLGKDIYFSSALTIGGSTAANICVDGQGMYSLNFLATTDNPIVNCITIPSINSGSLNVTIKACDIIVDQVTNIFKLESGNQVLLSDLNIESKTNTSQTQCVFLLLNNAENKTIENCTITAGSAGNIVNVFKIDYDTAGTTGCTGLYVTNVKLNEMRDVFHEAKNEGVIWDNCVFENLINAGSELPVTIESDFSNCSFSNIMGFNEFLLDYATGANNHVVTSVGVDTFTGGTANFLTGITGYSSITANSRSVTLNTANPSLTIGTATHIRLTLGASASGSITVVDGVQRGQQLVIECVSNAGTATIPDGSNHQLSAVWNPTAQDTLSLVFNGTVWVETARSVN
jgi:hypothetical protein